MGAAEEELQPTKKEQILSLYTSGIQDVAELALLTQSRTSYVASVLQDSGLLAGYFDLYTHTSRPRNVYSRFFGGKLGFKDEETARRGVALLDRFYGQFARVKDRAGQHHALETALTLYDRARWSGKVAEARVFRDWIVSRLAEDEPTAA